MTTAGARARGGANRKVLGAVVRLAIFTAVSLVVTGTLVAIMGKFGTGAANEYRAIFANASMVQKGDDVRVAGVVMGKVTGVEIHERNRAQVTFTVKSELPLTTASRVEIRYLNLVGDRYVTVLEGQPGAPQLEAGGTIPIEQTSPALNLTALYDGFAPLFNALSPKDVNDLSLNLIRVLQGEGGTIEGLLQHTASLTSAIADRDQLVGQVITNLNGLLTTVDSRHQQLTELVKELRRWVGGLAEDRIQIGNSVANLSSLTRLLAELVTQGRPLLKDDIAELRSLTKILASPNGKAVLNKILTNLPEMLADQTRTGTYGSWYNYYVCGAKFEITLPKGLDIPGINLITEQMRNFGIRSTAPRCNR
ncbi:MAG TPA: MlaD family protein [Nocardioidaceae bacterium]|nr:MlaD family protein [Nocardioidaceae bacterium]